MYFPPGEVLFAFKYKLARMYGVKEVSVDAILEENLHLMLGSGQAAERPAGRVNSDPDL